LRYLCSFHLSHLFVIPSLRIYVFVGLDKLIPIMLIHAGVRDARSRYDNSSKRRGSSTYGNVISSFDTDNLFIKQEFQEEEMQSTMQREKARTKPETSCTECRRRKQKASLGKTLNPGYTFTSFSVNPMQPTPRAHASIA